VWSALLVCQPTWTNCTRADINVKEYFRKHTFLWVYYVHITGSSLGSMYPCAIVCITYMQSYVNYCVKISLLYNNYSTKRISARKRCTVLQVYSGLNTLWCNATNKSWQCSFCISFLMLCMIPHSKRQQLCYFRRLFFYWSSSVSHVLASYQYSPQLLWSTDFCEVPYYEINRHWAHIT
jgi:hypothetical protein